MSAHAHLIGRFPGSEGIQISICEPDCAAASVPLMPAAICIADHSSQVDACSFRGTGTGLLNLVCMSSIGHVAEIPCSLDEGVQLVPVAHHVLELRSQIISQVNAFLICSQREL